MRTEPFECVRINQRKQNAVAQSGTNKGGPEYCTDHRSFKLHMHPLELNIRSDTGR